MDKAAQAVEEALATVRPSLQADGFTLSLESINMDGEATITLEALPDACADCLVPDEILVQILETAIRKSGSEVSRVVLTKRGFG